MIKKKKSRRSFEKQVELKKLPSSTKINISVAFKMQLWHISMSWKYVKVYLET